MTTPPDMQNRLAALGVRYLHRTADEVPVLREWERRLQQGELQALKEIEIVAHRIRGSGAMFGFPVISESAGAVEMLVTIDATMEGALEETLDARACQELAARLSKLIDAVDAAVSDARAKQPVP